MGVFDEPKMEAYGIRHALLVGPNSGYQFDNRCLLDALARGARRLPVGERLALPARGAAAGRRPAAARHRALLPDPVERRRLFWGTPRRWLGF